MEEVVSSEKKEPSSCDVVLDEELGIDAEIAALRVTKRVKPVGHFVFSPTVDIVELTGLQVKGQSCERTDIK